MPIRIPHFACLFLLFIHHAYILDKMVQVDQKLQHNVDPAMEVTKQFGWRFITTINFQGQALYLLMSIVIFVISACSPFIGWKLEKWNTIFYWTFVYPTTALVCTFFWSLFFIDRELIYPEIIDSYIPPYVNRAVHLHILVLPILETIFVDKKPPAMRSLIKYLWFYQFCLTAIPLYTHFVDGAWLYVFYQYMSFWHFVMYFVTCYAIYLSSVRFGLYIQRIKYKKTLEIKEI